MKMIIEDGALKLSIKHIVIAIRHPFRLSNEGNFHMPLLVLVFHQMDLHFIYWGLP